MGDTFRAVLNSLERWFARNGRGLTKLIALAVIIVTIPFALLASVPSIIGLFAPPLNNKIDLYTVNRPLAFTFLDEDGHSVGHRGAEIGDRLHLSEMPPYLPAAFIAMEDRRFYE